MSLEPAAEFFWRGVRKNTILPADVHRAAWRYARRTDDTSLSAALIGRKDAPADLVTSYGNLTEPALRDAYLQRRHVSTSQVTAGLAGERRAPVLAEALRRSGRHPAVLAIAVEAFLARPTKPLAAELATLPAERITPAVAEGIVTVADRGLYLGDEQLATVVGMLGRDRATRLLPRLTNGKVAAHLLAHDVGTDLVLDTVARLAPDLIARDIDNPEGLIGDTAGYRALQLFRGACTGRLGDPHVEDTLSLLLADHEPFAVNYLWNCLDGTDPVPATLRPWPAGAGDETRTVVTPDELDHQQVVVENLSGYELTALTGSDRPEVVAQVTARALALGDAGAMAARSLLWNPLLTVEHRHALVALVVNADPTGRLENGVLDPITMFPDDQVTIAAWCAGYPAHALEVHGWEPFGGRTRAADLVPTWAASSEPRHQAALTQALKTGFAADLLPQIPVPALLPLLHGATHGGASETMHALTTDIVAVELGDHPGAWTMFEHLHATFAGTLAELLDTCRAAGT